jgi:Flp pilus assembly protein TadG
MSQQHPMTVRSEIASAAIRRAARRLGTLARFGCDRRGNVLIFTAIGIFVLMGAAGLGTEVSSWYAQKRTMQNAADLGADSGILVLKKNLPGSATFNGYAQKEAKTATAKHGFADGSNSTTVIVNIPPTSGSYTNPSTYNYKAVEVVITKPASLLFASLFLPSAPTVKARSVAVIDLSGTDCMLATDPSSGKTAYFQGNFSISVPCGLADMSTNSSAVMTTGGAGSLTASSVRTAGGISDPGGTIHANQITGDNSITDPYASRTLPTLGSGYPTGDELAR